MGNGNWVGLGASCGDIGNYCGALKDARVELCVFMFWGFFFVCWIFMPFQFSSRLDIKTEFGTYILRLGMS